jgi:molybdopterin molybdotransferase
MTSYKDAVTQILNNVHVLPPEEKLLFKCIGQVTTEDIYSGVNLPQLASSGPDGYALRAADIRKASRENPVTLQITETVRAGILPSRKVKPGAAARVMTGSVLPKGADCVVRFEDTDEPPEKNGPNQNCPSSVKVFVAAAAGANVTTPGNIVRRGTLVVPKGTIIGPGQLSALISIGKTKIKVHRRPVIAVIATGDELVPSGKPLKRGKSYNSNTAALVALITYHGGIPKVLGIARDNQASLHKKITQGLSADVIVSSGGVSKGDFDLVRLVLGNIGKVVFASLWMGPGRAITFGLLNRNASRRKQISIPMFALSGPPAGCLINFETLVRPGLRKMLGYPVLRHPEVEAQAVDSASMKAPFPFVKWTKLEETETGYQVKFNPCGDAGFLAAMATANSLAILPKDTCIHPGDKVQVLPLDFCS